MYSDILEVGRSPLPNLPEEEAVGIIAMEDVTEELLQVLPVIMNNPLSFLKYCRNQAYLGREGYNNCNTTWPLENCLMV